MPFDLDLAPPIFPRLTDGARALVLNRIYGGWDAEAVLREAIEQDFPGRIALVSSFGAESVALLHLVAAVDRRVPVLFLQTGMLFPETLAYQRQIAERLGLEDVRLIRPDPAEVAATDPHRDLHALDTDACCALRKTRPLARALDGFDAWITGRKRFQSATRAALELFEEDAEGRLKINPLAGWDAARIRAHMARHDLPPHPMVERGFLSIGCAPCTSAVKPGEDARAGRWRGSARTECGIHFVDGRPVRGPAPAA